MMDYQKNFYFKGKFFILIILALVIIGVALIFIQKNKNDSAKKNQQNISQNRSQNKTDQKEPDCSKNLVVFTTEFTDFSKINAFQPIGSITGASRGRSYIEIKKGETVPVYAPTDATLTSIIYAYRGPDADHGEYGFKFDAKCGVTFLLDHLDSASSEMEKYAPTEPSRSTASNDSLSIPIKAGTLLGYTDGTPQARTFDFLVLDQNVITFHIKPSRWEWDQSNYSVCPYDLYRDELKAKYYQKIGQKTDVEFIKAQNCGDISYDIPGTISGGWFLDEKATDLKGEFLLIGSSYNRVDVVVKNDSEKINLRITDYSPKILPKDIGIDESVCYKGFSNDWAYIRLIDSNTLEINNGSGACPFSFPFSGAKKYYR
jgi:uncharacterized protein YxeA